MPDDTGNQLFDLADRVIDLAKLVVILLFFHSVCFTWFLSIYNRVPRANGRSSFTLRGLIQDLWAQVTPYVAALLRVIAPVFVLLFALGVLYRLGQAGATPFDVSKLFSDLPSLLALLIVVTICLLPLAGLPVPDILSNVALVVVGFYFGKRTGSEGGGS